MKTILVRNHSQSCYEAPKWGNYTNLPTYWRMWGHENDVNLLWGMIKTLVVARRHVTKYDIKIPNENLLPFRLKKWRDLLLRNVEFMEFLLQNCESSFFKISHCDWSLYYCTHFSEWCLPSVNKKGSHHRATNQMVNKIMIHFSKLLCTKQFFY